MPGVTDVIFASPGQVYMLQPAVPEWLVIAGCQFAQLAEVVKLSWVACSSPLRRDRHRRVVSP